MNYPYIYLPSNLLYSISFIHSLEDDDVDRATRQLTNKAPAAHSFLPPFIRSLARSIAHLIDREGPRSESLALVALAHSPLGHRLCVGPSC